MDVQDVHRPRLRAPDSGKRMSKEYEVVRATDRDGLNS